jgi:hypothetical protein
MKVMAYNRSKVVMNQVFWGKARNNFLECIFVLIPLMDLMMIKAHLLAYLHGDFYH